MAIQIGLRSKNLAIPYSLAVNPNPFEIVGEDDIVRETAVALDLIGLEDLVELFLGRVNWLDFNVSKNGALLANLEIRGAFAGLTFRLMLDGHASAREFLQQAFQSRASCMLGVLSDWRLTKGFKVRLEYILHTD